MTWAKATLYLLMFILSLVALGLAALYRVSAIGFGVALGVVATTVLGTFFMLAVAAAVRIINDGGRGRRAQASATGAPSGWQIESMPPALDANYHPVLGATRPALQPGAANSLALVDRGTIEAWSE